MDIKEMEKKAKNDFDNAISLMTIIPLLAFVYLLVVKIASLEILAGEIGYITFTILAVALTGILAGKKIIWHLIQELIEKNRLAAITETVLSLGHEINNPLLVIQGNLEMFDSDSTTASLPQEAKKRLLQIKSNCSRIMQATDKMSKLSKPASSDIYNGAKMIDLGKSK